MCARLREGEPGRRWDRNVPVIVLTAAGADPVERVRAFERGADDVVERELYPELVRPDPRRPATGGGRPGRSARGRRARRRPPGAPGAGPGRSRLARGARIRSRGRARDAIRSRVFSKDELLRDVWGYSGRLVTRTVDSHASRLRRKLRAAGAELPYVINVWGRGYRLLE